MNYDVITPTTSAAAVWAWRLYPGCVFCAASRTMSWEKSNETPSSSPSGVKAVLSFSWKCRKQSSRLAILSGDDLESFIFLSFFSFYSISLSPSFFSRHFPGFIMRKERVEELWNLRLEEKTNSLAHRWLSYGLKDYKNGYPGSRLWRGYSQGILVLFFSGWEFRSCTCCDELIISWSELWKLTCEEILIAYIACNEWKRKWGWMHKRKICG